MVPPPSDTPLEGVVHSPSSTAGGVRNGSFSGPATSRPQGGDGVGPHPVRRAATSVDAGTESCGAPEPARQTAQYGRRSS
jgi:hypothetical protein